MKTIALREDLYQPVQVVAQQERISVRELVNKAVSWYIAQNQRDKIRAEAQAFETMHAELRGKYAGKYVAINQRQVVDHDDNFRTLYLRVRERFGPVPVLIRQVTDKPTRELWFRSPRLERGGLG